MTRRLSRIITAMLEALIVANPVSGGGRAVAAVPALVESLKSHGIEARMVLTTPGHDEELDAAIRDASIVIAVGGDGTLNRVIRPIVLSRRPGPLVAFMAYGTANVATRAFGLPRRPKDVARAVAGARSRPLDAGIVTRDGAPAGAFVLWLGAGVDAALIHGVAARRAGYRGWGVIAQYALEMLRLLAGYRFPKVRVESESHDDHYGSVMLANIGPLAVGSVTRRADPFDGQIDLIATHPRNLLGWCAAALMASVHLYDRCPRVERRRVLRVRLSSSEPLPVHIDGEPFGHLPVDVEVVPAAVRLIVS
jgi:diacylglycerol kinase family enzyme